MPWYHSTWKIVLLGLAALIAIFAGALIFLTAKYWWQIKKGGAVIRPQSLAGQGFTASASKSSPPPIAIDRAQLENTDNPYLGRPTAPTVIVEFVDFKCQNCKTAAPIMRQVLSQYGYKLQYIVRYFAGAPVNLIHPGATQLATVMRCAEKQGKFWPAHDWVFNNQDQFPAQDLSPEGLAALAVSLDLDASALNSCLADTATAQKITTDFLDGARFGVGGTPTFFVNGVKVEGVIPLNRWKTFLDNVGTK